MKNLIRLLTVCLTVTLVTLAFTGCSGGGSGGASSSSSPSDNPAPSGPSLAFKLNDDGESYSVTGIGTLKDLDVVIPETYNSKPVTAIASSAFSDCKEITSVSIPNGVTSIGNNVFKNCDALQYNEHDNALYLGNDSNPYLVLVKAKEKTIESCQINSNVKLILANAFNKCTELTEISIPASATFIGNYALSECTKLSTLVIPEGVARIGEGAFQNCTSLTTISLPNSLSYIGANAFSECGALQYNEYDNAIYLGNETNPYVLLVNAKNDKITSCTIHSNTKCLYHGAFKDCFELRDPVIPNGVVFIGNYVFQATHVISTITIPESVTYISGYVFYNSWALKTVVILTNSAEIGFKSFQECRLLNDVYFKGTEEEWAKLTSKTSSWHLENANKYFYSETKPETLGNFWHFDENGEISLVW